MTQRVAVYCRQSSTDPDEMEASGSITDQRTALLDLSDRRGWTVAGVYEDPDAPANKLDRRLRWVDLVTDAQAGEFEVVAAFDTSRLWRSVDFKIHVCKTLAAAGVTTVATLGGDVPTDATDDPEGGLIATVLAAITQYDNEMRALKVRKAHARAAVDGVAWRGRRPFGWTPGRTEVIESEKAVIREAFERIVERKESTSSIVKDWNARGVPSSTGGLWARSVLVRMMRSPSLAGWRVHGAQRYEGQWTPILTREEHDRLVAELDGRGKRSGGLGTPRLLSSRGLLVCGLCGEALVGGTKSGGYRLYVCPPPNPRACRRIVVSADRAEEEVRDRVLASLDAGLVTRHIEAAASQDVRVSEASRTLATIEDQRQVIGRVFTKQRDEAAARAALDELEAVERKARQVLNQSAGGIEVLVAAAEDPHSWWRAADFLDRRRLLEVACERVIVHPAPGRSPVWHPERLEIRWRA